MGRPKKIDRGALLDAAEDIVMQRGAAALTIDALAKALGITKGGVQYSFASKDALIDAMLARWSASYTEVFERIADPGADPVRRIQAHVEATACSDDVGNARAAGLLAALLQAPGDLGPTRDWYRARLAGLDTASEGGRRARLAFLATEGAFMLRYFGLVDIDRAEWDDMFKDIASSIA